MPEENTIDFTPVVEEIRKQNEGVTLGLGALAEVLDRMNTRLSKADDDEEKTKREEEEEEEQKAMYNVIKEIVKQELRETGETKEKKASGLPEPPAEKEADVPQEKIKNKPEQSQTPVVGMKKQDEEEEDQNDDEEDEDKEEYPELEAMKKENADLKTQIEEMKKSIVAEVRKATDSRLRKMGWKEEKQLAGVVRKELGDDNPPIIKAADVTSEEDVIEQLSKLSYSALNKLRFQVEMGNTDGIPQEIVKALS